MSEPSPTKPTQQDEIAAQLDKTAADLRTLGEQLGAIRPGSATVSRRRAATTFTVVVLLAALAAWFIWDHWHSLIAATAPLVWIFAHGWRRRQRMQRRHDR